MRLVHHLDVDDVGATDFVATEHVLALMEMLGQERPAEVHSRGQTLEHCPVERIRNNDVALLANLPALRSVRIRQAARRAFDLTRLGNGPLERICSALLLGGAISLVVFLIAHFTKLQSHFVIGIAVGTFVCVITTCGALVLWKSDAELEEQAEQLPNVLAKLREEEAAEQAAWEAEADELAARLEEQGRRAAAREAEEARKAADLAAEEARRAAEEAARPKPTTRRCPFCREEILFQAAKCKHCGEILADILRAERQPYRRQSNRGNGVFSLILALVGLFLYIAMYPVLGIFIGRPSPCLARFASN